MRVEILDVGQFGKHLNTISNLFWESLEHISTTNWHVQNTWLGEVGWVFLFLCFVLFCLSNLSIACRRDSRRVLFVGQLFVVASSKGAVASALRAFSCSAYCLSQNGYGRCRLVCTDPFIDVHLHWCSSSLISHLAFPLSSSGCAVTIALPSSMQYGQSVPPCRPARRLGTFLV